MRRTEVTSGCRWVVLPPYGIYDRIYNNGKVKRVHFWSVPHNLIRSMRCQEEEEEEGEEEEGGGGRRGEREREREREREKKKRKREKEEKRKDLGLLFPPSWAELNSFF